MASLSQCVESQKDKKKAALQSLREMSIFFLFPSKFRGCNFVVILIQEKLL